MTVEGLGRLSLVPRLEGRRFRPPSKIACDPKTRGDRPRFRTDVAAGNVRLLVALFCSRALSLPFLPPPTPRRLGAMVWPYPAAWQVRSAQRHFGRRQRDDDQARRVDTQRQTTDNSCERLLPVLFSTKTTINPLPGEDCAVVAEKKHAARKVQQQCNDRARDFIETSVSMEIVKSTLNIHTHE